MSWIPEWRRHLTPLPCCRPHPWKSTTATSHPIWSDQLFGQVISNEWNRPPLKMYTRWCPSSELPSCSMTKKGTGAYGSCIMIHAYGIYGIYGSGAPGAPQFLTHLDHGQLHRTTTSRHFHPNSKGSLSKTPKKPYETMLTAGIHEFYQWLSSDFLEVSPYFPMESIGFHWFPWYENGNANRDAANQGHSLLHRLPKDPDLLRRRVGPRLVDLPSGKHTKKLWKINHFIAGKSTISTGPFSIISYVKLPVDLGFDLVQCIQEKTMNII